MRAVYLTVVSTTATASYDEWRVKAQEYYSRYSIAWYSNEESYARRVTSQGLFGRPD